ncbi:MAG: hypothetical protein GVY09_13260 [Gammaproteobacteria bacterium]|nr:hypothetical protein [Gammaproteobacteria bacterium]
MTFPEPHPGLVISYSYLLAEEHERGQEEGVKDRPCTVVVARQSLQGQALVTVLPITHTPPSDPTEALEIPPPVKAMLGLDDERSWIVLSEMKDFLWPGPDLRPVAPGRPVYGVLPPGFFRQLRTQLLETQTRRKLAHVTRTE